MHQHTFKLVFGIFFILLSVCSFVYASDQQLILQCGGDEELIIGCVGDQQNTFFSNFLPVEPSGSPSTGGASVFEVLSVLGEAYNKTLVCGEIELFITNKINVTDNSYSDEDYNEFKNNLIIKLGVGIDDSVLKYLIQNYDKECVQDVVTKVDNNGKIKYRNYLIYSFLLIILVFAFFIVFDNYKRKDDSIWSRIKMELNLIDYDT